MSDKNHTDTVPVNAFSPGYVSQLRPFRERPKPTPVLERTPLFNLQKTIATPDLGKRARLLKANI